MNEHFFNYYGYEDQPVCKTLYEQREAVRLDVPQDTLETTEVESFFKDTAAPTPNIESVDGFKAESELED
ncbi:MAG: hypothetical protein LUD72_06905 [Bacteroidales bacterium]|nr:hypothetical protein [Bacteroidales bacterium]